MNLKDELFSTFVVASTCEYITFFSCADLGTYCIHNSLLNQSFQGEIIVSTVTQAITIVYIRDTQRHTFGIS
jgi:hypothetical protein